MTKHYEVIVVGAGSMGMAAGYYLAEQGVRTLMIDAFDPPHENGSHAGETKQDISLFKATRPSLQPENEGQVYFKARGK